MNKETKVSKRNKNRFAPEAYATIRETLDYATNNNHQPTPTLQTDEASLANAFCHYVKLNYGPMGAFLLHEWGIHNSEDLGTAIAHLIKAKLIDAESPADPNNFKDLFDFDTVFVKPYKPQKITTSG